MNTRSKHPLRGFLLSLIVVTALAVVAPTPVHAASGSPRTATPQAVATWTWTSIRSRVEGFIHNSFRSRARLVQISAVAVALGLFIMFRCRRT